jgi:hypothetical protein
MFKSLFENRHATTNGYWTLLAVLLPTETSDVANDKKQYWTLTTYDRARPLHFKKMAKGTPRFTMKPRNAYKFPSVLEAAEMSQIISNKLPYYFYAERHPN